MKKYPIFTLLALTLVAGACVRELDVEVPETEKDAIVLQLVPLKAETKAGKDGTKPGVADYNENTIGSQVDVFFYAIDVDDDTPAIKSMKATVTGTDNNKKTSIPTSIPMIREIFGSTNAGRKCKVLVVANYNGATAINHERATGYTRNELKALELAEATWGSLGQDSQDKRFEPSDTPAFVMTGEAELESGGINAAPIVSGTVNLARIPAKVTFSVTVKDEIDVDIYAVDYRGNRIKVLDPDGEWTGEYKKETVTMKPSKQAMVVNLVYANKYAELSGESYVPTGTKDPKLFDYVYRPFDESEGVYTAQPFYSYPQKWGAGAANQPYLKLVIPWTPYDENGTAGSTKNYYYKIPLPEGELKSNNWYQIGLDVSILGGEEQEPIPVEIKYCVAPWVAGSVSDASVVSARYLSVPRKSYTMYNTEELAIPMSSSHPCEIVNVTVTKPKYGSSSYSNTTVNFTNATTTDGKLVLNSKDVIDLVHTINNTMGNSLDCAPYTITFRVCHTDNAEYYQDITIVQYPAIYIEKSTGGNAFVDGYYSLVAGGKPDEGAVSRTTSNFAHYYHYGYFSVDNGRRVTPYGNLNGVSGGTQANNNYDGPVTVPTSERENTRIHVTAFSENSKTYRHNGSEKPYIIGDPRIPFMSASQISDKTLVPYLTPGGSGNVTTAWTEAQLNALMVGTDVDNIIAPAFMFASEWGRQGNGESSFQTVAKRCATYQEAGYPAGRWRLPTEAEVAFVGNLQANEFIGTLFAGGTYWISNGHCVQVSTGGVTDRGTTGGNSTRCVYDIWYWGEDPVQDPTYHYAVMP